MRTAIRVVLGALLGVAALLVVWFLGMRTKHPAVLDLQRRLNRRVFNPHQMRSAGTPGAYAGIVRHVGRRSGRTYETPVVPLPNDEGFAVVLPYGTRSDWVRNVRAAGSATIVHEGAEVDVCDPRLAPVEESGYEFTAKERRDLRLFGNAQCLLLRRVADDPTQS